MSLLENINSAADLRRLPANELQTVADEIRQYILETMSRIGGHTGASLGAIELAVEHGVLSADQIAASASKLRALALRLT